MSSVSAEIDYFENQETKMSLDSNSEIMSDEIQFKGNLTVEQRLKICEETFVEKQIEFEHQYRLLAKDYEHSINYAQEVQQELIKTRNQRCEEFEKLKETSQNERAATRRLFKIKNQKISELHDQVRNLHEEVAAWMTLAKYCQCEASVNFAGDSQSPLLQKTNSLKEARAAKSLKRINSQRLAETQSRDAARNKRLVEPRSSNKRLIPKEALEPIQSKELPFRSANPKFRVKVYKELSVDETVLTKQFPILPKIERGNSSSEDFEADSLDVRDDIELTYRKTPYLVGSQQRSGQSHDCDESIEDDSLLRPSPSVSLSFSTTSTPPPDFNNLKVLPPIKGNENQHSTPSPRPPSVKRSYTVLSPITNKLASKSKTPSYHKPLTIRQPSKSPSSPIIARLPAPPTSPRKDFTPLRLPVISPQSTAQLKQEESDVHGRPIAFTCPLLSPSNEFKPKPPTTKPQRPHLNHRHQRRVGAKPGMPNKSVSFIIKH
eukprot:TCONS_00053438-protein